MIIIPAIDIKGGSVVRLVQGRPEAETVYSNDPLAVARKFADAGAELIHIVDLDGAFGGTPRNTEMIKKIAAATDVKIEVGGGLRDEKAIEEALAAGVYRAVLGTKALDDKFLASAADRFGTKIAVGIDGRDGYALTEGWVSKSPFKTLDLIGRVEKLGVRTIIYTDVARDGVLQGPNIKGLKDVLKSTRMDVVASGGISTMDDIEKLLELEEEGLKGMIIGKAIYEGRIDLAEAIKACGKNI